jgi:hypothetical protein
MFLSIWRGTGRSPEQYQNLLCWAPVARLFSDLRSFLVAVNPFLRTCSTTCSLELGCHVLYNLLVLTVARMQPQVFFKPLDALRIRPHLN